MKPYTMPRIICFLLSALLLASLFLPIFTANDKLTASFEAAEAINPDYMNTEDPSLCRILGFGSQKGFEDITPNDLKSISYFDFALRMHKITVGNGNSLFTENLVYSDRNRTITVSIGNWWLPFILGALGIIWSLFNLPVLEIINSILSLLITGFLAIMFNSLLGYSHIPFLDNLPEDIPVAQWFNFGQAWKYYVPVIISFLLLIISIVHKSGKRKYKKRLKAKHEKADRDYSY